MKTGLYELDAGVSKVTVYTFKEGLLSKLAHDLVIDAATMRGEGSVEDEHLAVEVTIDASSLKVVSDNVSASQKTEIRDNIRGKKILQTSRHPEIKVQGRVPAKPGTHQVTMTLTIVGRPLNHDVDVDVTADGESVTLKTRLGITQSRYGIKPYTAMMGTLKIQDRVELEGTLVFVPAS